MQKLNVGFIFGGDSAEREVSIVTMLQIKRLAEVSGWMIPHYIFWDKNGKDMYKIDGKYLVAKTFEGDEYKKLGRAFMFAYGGDAVSVKAFKRRIFHVDAVVNCCHGGYGESGELSGFMKVLGIPFTTPSVLGLGVSMDKHIFKSLMRAVKIKVPSWVSFSKSEFENTERFDVIKEKISRLGEEVIVKPNASGSSLGVSISEGMQEVENAIRVAFKFDSRVIVERVIPNLVEFNCVCMKARGETIVTDVDQIERSGDMFTFEQKYIGEERGHSKVSGKKLAGMAGAARMLPAPISDELTGKIKQVARKVFDTLGLVAPARVDFLFDSERGELFVGEVNAVPGSMGLYFFERTNFDGLRVLREMVMAAISEHKKQLSVSDEFVPKIFRK